MIRFINVVFKLLELLKFEKWSTIFFDLLIRYIFKYFLLFLCFTDYSWQGKT